MKILMVLTSHDRLGETGHKTGFWLEEFAAPFYRFLEAGADIRLASPAGGQPPVDPKSEAEEAQTDATRRFQSDIAAQALLASTRKLAAVEPERYDALFIPGGHGPLWDLAESPEAIAIIEHFVKAKKPIGAVCHGPAVFRHVRNEEGSFLVKGKSVTGFSNTEEAAIELDTVVPFALETMLIENGGHFEKAEDWHPHTVVDGLLVTGQNPASSDKTARALLALLS